MALVVGFEGLPGCGKTTVIELLIRILRAMGIVAVAVDIDMSVHTPSLRAIADALPLDNLVRSMLFWSMRREQYRMVQELREYADVVLMDRTWRTAYAVDGYGNGVPEVILDWVGQGLNPPDVTFFLHVPLEVARARKQSRTMRDLCFAKRVNQGYSELARIHSWSRVDATRTPEEIKEHCLEIILAALAGSADQP